MPQRAALCPPGDQSTRENVLLWCLGLRFGSTGPSLGWPGPRRQGQRHISPWDIFSLPIHYGTCAGPTFLLDGSSWALEKGPQRA